MLIKFCFEYDLFKTFDYHLCIIVLTKTCVFKIYTVLVVLKCHGIGIHISHGRVNLTKWYLTKQLPIKFEHKIEPHHNTTNKMTCAPSEDSDQAGHPLSLISLPIERTD